MYLHKGKMGRLAIFTSLTSKNKCAMPLSNLWQLLLKADLQQAAQGTFCTWHKDSCCPVVKSLENQLPLNFYHYFPQSPWPSILTTWTSHVHVHSALSGLEKGRPWVLMTKACCPSKPWGLLRVPVHTKNVCWGQARDLVGALEK